MAPNAIVLPRPAPRKHVNMTPILGGIAIGVVMVLVIWGVVASTGGTDESFRLAREYTSLTGQPVSTGWYDPDLMGREEQLEAVAEARAKAQARSLRATSRGIITPLKVGEGEIIFSPDFLTGYRAVVEYKLDHPVPDKMPPPPAGLRVGGEAPATVMPGNSVVDVMFPTPVAADRVMVDVTTGTITFKELTLFVAG